MNLRTASVMLVGLLTLSACGSEEEDCNCKPKGLKVTVPKGQVKAVYAGELACQGASIECETPGVQMGLQCDTYRVLPTGSGLCNVIVEFSDSMMKSKPVAFSYSTGCCTGFFAEEEHWDLTSSP